MKLVFLIAITIGALQTTRAQLSLTCDALRCPPGLVCEMKFAPCFRLSCNKQPQCVRIIEKEGACPAVSVPRIAGDEKNGADDCTAYCEADNSCPGIEKCCMDGCKKMCMQPRSLQPAVSTPGFCPTFPDVTLPSCDTRECSADLECGDGLKCCAYGCSSRCMTPLNTTTPAEHAGVCPINNPNIPDNCSISCTSDDDCFPNHKCCLSGCSMKCSPAPQIHHVPSDPGYCPTVAANVSAPCKIDCITTDRSCNRNQKCCDYGCSRACMDPIEAPPGTTKAGECPPITPEIILSNCSEQCRFDNTCLGSQKCCQYACVSICLEPTPGSIEPVPVPTPVRLRVPAVFERLGSCPTNVPSSRFPCRDMCADDARCPGSMKCCKFGCGKRCLNIRRPVIPPGSVSRKPLFCPMFQASTSRSCGNIACRSDMVCPGSKKCCNDGCNTMCYDAVDTPPQPKAGSCPQLPAAFQIRVRPCSDVCDSDQGCSGSSKCCLFMGCKRCLQATNIPPTVSAAVHCPEFPADVDTNSTCEPSCASDTACSGGQMCCPYGCSTKCATPTTTPSQLKPGFCKATSSNIVLPICLNTCTSDTSCKGRQKCCGFGCSKRCTEPMASRQFLPRPGFCPSPTSSTTSSTSVDCRASCSSDWACGQNEKCCYNGCKRECVAAVSEAAPTKPGFCPKIITTPVTATTIRTLKCGMFCNSDQMCPGDLKCCRVNHCRHECVARLDSPPSELKLGFCPASVVTDESCSRTCSSELDCAGSQKCCFQGGCIQKCSEAVTVLPSQRTGVCPSVSALPAQQCTNGRNFCNSDHACPEPLKCCFDGCGQRCMNVESSIVSTKPGFCPASSIDAGDSCLVSCSTDDSCPADQKCCSTGCGIGCVNATSAPPRDKAGFCPFIPMSLSSVCRESCRLDDGCPGTMKCCQNGCSRECYSPVAVPTPVSKAGFCPAATANTTCDNPCNSDIACAGDRKCCQLGCGMSCVAPVANAPAAKVGFCPFVHPDVSTMCLQTCSSDSSCAGTAKCCSYGSCSMRCMVPSRNPHQTAKSGMCPDTVIRTAVTTSVLCRSDFACAGEQKCCKIGTSMTCAEPKKSQTEKDLLCPNIPFNIIPTCFTPRCADDSQCGGRLKCCKFGCNSMCLNGSPPQALVSNPGYCPYVSPNVLEPCSSSCTSDTSCGDGKKCCQRGCSMRCMNSQPFPPTMVKPGSCPAPQSNRRLPFYRLPGGLPWFVADRTPTEATYAYRNCRNDGQCPGTSKCCRSSIGGTVCVSPT